MPKPTIYRLALSGFGAVGQGLAQIIRQQGPYLLERYNLDLRIIAVQTRSWGAFHADGLDLNAIQHAYDTKMFDRIPFPKRWDARGMIEESGADVFVEVTPTNFADGEPATSNIRAAFARGMHVVTANKGPLALFGTELQAEAARAGVGFGFEGTVMGGTPALRLALDDLAGCRVQAVRGIINGTTNYILSQMDQGQEFDAALALAQQLGYAEADPSGDVDGHDAAGKAVILANMVFGATLRPNDVERRGIGAISASDVAAAHAAGERWKLIADIRRDGSAVRARVAPERIPLSHPLAGVSGATNALTVSTDLLGDVTLIGPGAGGVATGFAILSDILAIHRRG